MQETFRKLEPWIYAVLRVLAGAMFVCHGIQKVFGVWGVPAMPLTSQMGIGGLIELTTGVMIALGVGTRAAAFIASGQMAVAYFQFHAKDGILPIQNGGDDTVLYCFLFLLFVVRGSGRFALIPSSSAE